LFVARFNIRVEQGGIVWLEDLAYHIFQRHIQPNPADRFSVQQNFRTASSENDLVSFSHTGLCPCHMGDDSAEYLSFFCFILIEFPGFGFDNNQLAEHFMGLLNQEGVRIFHRIEAADHCELPVFVQTLGYADPDKIPELFPVDRYLDFRQKCHGNIVYLFNLSDQKFSKSTPAIVIFLAEMVRFRMMSDWSEKFSE